MEKIHRQIVDEMLCQRHEVHPMYPSDFASTLETLSFLKCVKLFITFLIFEMKMCGCYSARYRFMHAVITRKTYRFYSACIAVKM